MSTQPIRAGHEVKDASIRGIALAGLGLAIVAGLVALLVYGIFRYLAEHPVTTAPANPMAETDRMQIPPAPRIEEHPAIEIQALRAQEDRVLSTYGWTDKQKDIVHIPIGRAMELQLERGFPTRRERAK